GGPSRKQVIPGLGDGAERYRGLVVPIGVDGEGGLVAAACARPDFPTEVDQLLLSMAANHAATAFQGARTEQILRHARSELETKVAERTAELWQASTELQTTLASERAAFAEAMAARQRFADLVNSVEGIVWEADVPSFQFSFVS